MHSICYWCLFALVSFLATSDELCEGISVYQQSHGYQRGDTVRCDNGLYECRVSRWCNGNPNLFSPCKALYWTQVSAFGTCGESEEWENAWRLIGDCSGSTPAPSTTTTSTTSTTTSTTSTTTSTTSTTVSTTSTTTTPTTRSAITDVEQVLHAASTVFDEQIFLYQLPTQEWAESDIYRFDGFIKGLRLMYQTGIAGKKFYLGSDLDNGPEANIAYLMGLTNIALFLAQSMKETIQYNACDENSWDLVNGKYPLSNACGQLGQSYSDYSCPAGEEHMACELDPTMEITATTNARWYGAPGPLFCAPKTKFETTGYWDYNAQCNLPWQTPPETCDVYEGQQAGKIVDEPTANRAGRTDVESCCYWGRGVIQTTGICNFGKLNYYLGKRAAQREGSSSYPHIDFCRQPDKICSDPNHPELKWVAGYFYWIESLQSYDTNEWQFLDNLQDWVRNGMNIQDTSLVDAVSGVVNRGCPRLSCSSGSVDGVADRRNNFAKVMTVLKPYLLPEDPEARSQHRATFEGEHQLLEEELSGVQRVHLLSFTHYLLIILTLFCYMI